MFTACLGNWDYSYNRFTRKKGRLRLHDWPGSRTWQTIKQSYGQSYPPPSLLPFLGTRVPLAVGRQWSGLGGVRGAGGAGETCFRGMRAGWGLNRHSSGPCLRHSDCPVSTDGRRTTNDQMTLQPYLRLHLPPHSEVDSDWGRVCPEAGQKGSKWGVVSTKERGKEKKREWTGEFCVLLLWLGVARLRGIPTMLLKGPFRPLPIDFVWSCSFPNVKISVYFSLRKSVEWLKTRFLFALWISCAMLNSPLKPNL